MDKDNYILKLEHERWYLINYLEDKIKECDNYLKQFIGMQQGDYSVYYYRAEWEKKIYQELLDKIKEGNYE